jgi:hypothetical protein
MWMRLTVSAHYPDCIVGQRAFGLLGKPHDSKGSAGNTMPIPAEWANDCLQRGALCAGQSSESIAGQRVSFRNLTLIKRRLAAAPQRGQARPSLKTAAHHGRNNKVGSCYRHAPLKQALSWKAGRKGLVWRDMKTLKNSLPI